jgi:hypothetical protein
MKNFLLIYFLFFSSILFSQSITTKEPVHNFGTVEYGSPCINEFLIYNEGTKSVSITQCKPSCGCVLTECPTQEILPGKFTVVTVNYDTKREGPINKSITLYLSDPQQPILILRIRGNVLKKSE